jgi:hypothetical protein
MSSPINAMLNGTFTTDATPSAVTLSLPSGATEIEIINVTDFNTPAASIITAEGYSSTLAGSAITKTGNGATPNVLTERVVVTGGFTFFDDSGLAPIGGAVVNAAGGITQANGAVVTSATTPAVGSVVRMYNTTAMLQIAGMDFTVTAINPGVTMTLGYLNSAGFAAAATANSFRVLPFAGVPLSSGQIAPDPRFYPRNRYITAITAGATTLVQLSVAHSYQVGEKVRINVPAEFGMVEINGLLGTVIAVNYTTNTITLDINSTGFTAFAFPTSAVAAAGINFAQCVPVGEAAVNTIALPVGNRLDDRTRNTSVKGVVIGSGVLVASKSYAWIAKKGLTI